MNPILTSLAIALALSAAGNVFLGSAYLKQRDSATEAKVETVYITAAAKECSQATETLQAAGKKRAAENAPKAEAAKAEADKHERKADQILAASAAVPGDACKSADALVDAWWEARK